MGVAVVWAAACGDADPDVTGPTPVRNRAPQAVGTIPEQTLSVGETAMVDLSSYFSDPDGDALSYTAASSNTGVASASVSGSSVVVTALARGVATVTVTARDAQGLLAQQRFQVTVPNRAPEAVDAIPARTVFAGRTASVDASLYFRDPDADPLTYTATSSNPEVATVTVAAATITMRAVTSGVATITVSASDPDGGAARQTVQVIVPNREPQAVGTIPERTLSVGETATVDLSSYFTDPDGDALSYTAASSNTGVASASVSGSSVVVTALARGVVTVTVTAHDPRGLGAQQRFQLTVPNQAPEAVDAIPAQAVSAGETATVDMSPYFSDPDGDELSYDAASSNTEVVEVSVTGSSVVVAARARRCDRYGDGPRSGRPERLVLVCRYGRDRRGQIPDRTDLRNVHDPDPEGGLRAGRGALDEDSGADGTPGLAGAPNLDLRRRSEIRALCGDDRRRDDPGGRGRNRWSGRDTLAEAGACWRRTGTLMPLYGRMEFDVADLQRLERRGTLEDVVLHEMGHVLGIGTIWSRLGLLRDPASETEAPDTHFTGPLAIEAFDEAGGTGYRGAKVPVENRGGPGSRNAHWRETVLRTELMTPSVRVGGSSPLSAITIQSLADLGYSVDTTAADPYRLPDADAARDIDPGRLIPYGDDIWRGPVVIVDRDGRIVRVIPGSNSGDRRRF